MSCINGANAILCRDSQYTKMKAYWAMHYVLCLMSRLSIQEIKALDTSMVQMLCYVHMFLPITFLIFNGFSIRKKFWNAENQGFPIKSYMSIVSTVSTLPVQYCIEILWLVSTYIGFGGMVGKPWFSAFQNFFRIENPLNIKNSRYKDYETQYIQWYACRYCRYRVQITVCILIQTIRIGKYFELMLRITWNFELKLCITSN